MAIFKGNNFFEMGDCPQFMTYKESDLQDYFWKDECISIDIFFRKNIGMSIIYSTDFRINNLTNVNPCAIILALWKTKYQQN